MLPALDGVAWHRGVAWHCGVAGSTHPKPGCPYIGKLSLDPCAEPPLPQWGWEVTSALGKREGTRICCSERGLVSAGVEEAVGEGVEAAHFR